jgi:hypothetical protein
MPRERIYSSNAERQAAYRARVAEHHALAGSGQLVSRVRELEAALAAMTRRAENAEQRAVRAEAQVGEFRDRSNTRDRNAAARPDRTPPGPKGRDQVRLLAAMQRIAELEATIDGLHQQLAAAAAPKAAGPNRAARRAAERDQRRRH